MISQGVGGSNVVSVSSEGGFASDSNDAKGTVYLNNTNIRHNLEKKALDSCATQRQCYVRNFEMSGIEEEVGRETHCT